MDILLRCEDDELETVVPEYRLGDNKAFSEKIRHIPQRIIVEGTRGKSSTVLMLEEQIRRIGRRTLAKTTGVTSQLIVNGEKIALPRDRDGILLDDEGIPSILHSDIDVLIFENPAITPDSMRYVHAAIEPHHVVIPNIRIDHIEGLGNDPRELTETFTKNLLATRHLKNVYYAEPIRNVHDFVYPILAKFAENHPDRIRLHDVNVPKKYQKMPGIENLCITSYVMAHIYRERINARPILDHIRKKLQIRINAQDIRYFDASQINDPVSCIHMLSYLLDNTEDPIALIGYFRQNQAGRNDLFEDYFDELDDTIGDRIERIWFAGYGTDHVYSRLSSRLKKVARPDTRVEDIDEILAFARSQRVILIPMVNRVNPFMDRLIHRLENPGGRRGSHRYVYDPVRGFIRADAIHHSLHYPTDSLIRRHLPHSMRK